MNRARRVLAGILVVATPGACGTSTAERPTESTAEDRPEAMLLAQRLADTRAIGLQLEHDETRHPDSTDTDSGEPPLSWVATRADLINRAFALATAACTREGEHGCTIPAT